MHRIQTDIPILKNRRAVYVLAFGIVFAMLSLVAGWIFTLEPAYMNYAPQARRDRMERRDFGNGLVAELAGAYRPVPDVEGTFRTPWGEEIQLWIEVAETSGLWEDPRGGSFTLRGWRNRLAPDGKVVACRHVRHPLGFGAEILARTETSYIHHVALVEGTERRGALPSGARVIRLRIEVPVKRYGTFRPLLVQTISTLTHDGEEGDL